MKALIGKQIEHYRIESIVGEGGMGTVYRATDLNLMRPVAMKVMHPHFAAQAQFQNRFQQEARAAARLSHSSIVAVYHFGREQGLLYIVMELVPGLSLGKYIQQLAGRNQVVHLSETVLLMAQVADALGYAHRKGLVHRDVKPDNIIVKRLDHPERPGEPPLRAVVTDFGLVKLLEGGVQTESGEFMGTLAYVSPEHVLDQPLDGRSDVYSLGVVLFQLATGQLPFSVRSPSDAIMKHINQPPPLPRTLQPGLPESLEKVILKALAKQPADRFQTAEAMASALREAARDLSDADVAAFVESASSSVVSIVASLKELPDPEDTPARARSAEKPARQRDQLRVTREGESGTVYSLYKRKFTIGRSAECDVILKGANVSRRHAQLEKISGAWHLADLGSANGTFLDDLQLTPNTPRVWHSAQKARIGAFVLELERAPDARDQAAARAAADDGDTPLRVKRPPAPAAPRRPFAQPAPQRRPEERPPIIADIRPAILQDGGIVRVLLLNQGRMPTAVTVDAADLGGKIRFDVASKQLTIGPGQKGLVDFYLEPRKRRLLGRVRRLPFQLEVRTGPQRWETLRGELESRPVWPAWLATMLVLLTVLLGASLAAVFFLLA
jgi:eukaryotic-like serine/threonine-protein kinase